MLATHTKLPLSLIMGLSMSGCTILSPSPLFEVIKAGGMAASTAIAQGPSDASYLIHHGMPPANMVCIEYNPDTQISDILPAIQNELRTHGIKSRVYETNTSLDRCDTWLKYSASMEWDTKPLSSTYLPYMTKAMLTLQKSEGEILASSGYELGSELQMGKWSSTRNKLARAIEALIKGEVKTAQNPSDGAQP